MSKTIEVCVPDIGNATDVDVIEVLVAVGDTIAKDDSIITLESDKASMEIPSPSEGVVAALELKEGDTASEGDLILTLTAAAESTETTPAKPEAEVPQQEKTAAPPKPVEKKAQETAVSRGDVEYASPAVRRLARELEIDVGQLTGSGRKGRVTKEDLQNLIKARMQNGKGGIGVAAAPAIDFSQFGEIETQPLNKIKRLTGANLHRSWVTVPHVTQFDEADITELEAFRKSHKAEAERDGYKLTPLAFIMKAVTKALQRFPQFNASLSPDGQALIYKRYYHIGVAVDTPNGLVVPVLRNADQKGVYDVAKEMGAISQKAREKGLMPQDMQGGCFTISSLGGIGGTAFTPIVNNPEVAILGVSRAKTAPVYHNEAFTPRLILPLSLSYDHRVIDGAEAARFTAYLAACLSDIRKLLL